MASFNKVVLVGNITRDPELKHLPSGAAVCEFGLAVNRQWFDKQSNQKKEEVSFIDIVAFGRTAEVICEYTSKGSSILIEGRLKQETWDDKQSGAKRSKLKVICETMTMLGKGEKREPKQEQQQEFVDTSAAEAAFEENVPF